MHTHKYTQARTHVTHACAHTDTGTRTHTYNTHRHTHTYAVCLLVCVSYVCLCVCVCAHVTCVLHACVRVCAPGPHLRPLLGLHRALFFGSVSPTVNSAGRSSAHFYALWPNGLPCQKITCESGAGRLEGEAHSGRRDWLRVSCRLRFASTELQQERDH